MGLGKGVTRQAQRNKTFCMCFVSWLQPYPSNPLAFQCKFCGPDYSFSCATNKGYLESHPKMYGLKV